MTSSHTNPLTGINIEKTGENSYRVAWDDGHESTFRPTAGTVHTLHPPEPEE